jgi:hypothetical protein
MATSVPEVSILLDELEIRHRVTDAGHLAIAYRTDVYRDPAGARHLMLIIALEEGGEYFKLFAPGAFDASGPHTDAFLRAIAIVQWRTKLVQFEFDDSDGEIRPIVEFPLEDAELTARQLERCVRGLVRLIDTYYPPLRRALDTGDVSFEDVEGSTALAGALGDFLSGIPPEVLAEALRRADERRRDAGEPGGDGAVYLGGDE